MSYSWSNISPDFNQKYFQSIQSSRQNDTQSKTKAYFNPEIVNCEYIKNLSQNRFQRSNKIHVNPNFKGLNEVYKNTNPNVNNIVITNAQESHNEAGPSSSSCNSEHTSKGLHSYKSQGPKSTTVVTHQSRFKKVNVNVKFENKNSSQYSWSSSRNHSDVIRSKFKINRTTSAPTAKTIQGKNQFVPGENTFKNTSKSLIKLQSQMHQSSKNISIYKSKTKIINESKIKLLSSASPKNKLNLKDKKLYSPIKRQLNLSKFVFNNKISPTARVAKAVRTKYKYLNTTDEFRKSKYKIDKRNKLQETIKKKLTAVKDIRKLFPDYFYTRTRSPPYKLYQVDNRRIISKNICSWKNNTLSNKVSQKVINQSPNQRVVKIGGILYKASTNKLTLANKPVPGGSSKSHVNKSKAKKNYIVYVRGEKFILENNGKALRRATNNTKTKKGVFHTTKRIDIGGVTYIQKSQNVLIRTNVHRARHLVKKAKNKSIAMLANLHKRSSMPCMIYHKFGKCSRHDNGLCIYKHDPKNIALCKKFLKGSCFDTNCLLSHQVIHEKMATCQFFLNGLCVRENCPYLHVKLNKNVAICKDFLQGFCNLGRNCSKRHFHQCPDFDKYGTCSLGSKCLYPHKKQNKLRADNSNEPESQCEKVQYYVNSDAQKKQKRTKKMSSKEKESSASKSKKIKKRKTLCLDSSKENNELITCFPKRIRLEKLPCYIPLKSDS